MPPDIVSIQKNFNGATIATVQKPAKSGTGGGSSNDYIKKVDFRRYNFSTPAMNHTIIHGMNTTQFLETIRDEDGNRVYAQIEILDENSVDIKLTEAMPLTVDILFGIEFVAP